jgi:hypothetical protein
MISAWKRHLVLFMVAAGSLTLAQTGLAQQESSCVNCHRELQDEKLSPPVEDWLRSVHKGAGVGCHSCHGGDPNVPDIMAMATDDYIGVPSVKQVPELCGSCHSDADKMRKYNLRVDEYQLFRRSGHGRALYERGDTKVATCVSCHGAHKILKKEDVESPVHYTNIARTCGACHADPAYMEGYGLPTNQVAEYSESYHAKILRGEIEGKNPALAPTCASCHTHSPLLPEAVEVPEICGRCHTVTASYYKDGPHYESLTEVGVPRCVDCHGNHLIKYPTAEMFSGVEEGRCGSCHDSGSEAYQLGQKVRSQLEIAAEKVQIMERELADIEHSGRNLSDLQTLTEEAQTSLTEVLPITHTLSQERITERTSLVIEKADALLATVNQFKAELRARKRNMAIILAVILVNIGLLYMKRRSMEKG